MSRVGLFYVASIVDIGPDFFDEATTFRNTLNALGNTTLNLVGTTLAQIQDVLNQVDVFAFPEFTRGTYAPTGDEAQAFADFVSNGGTLVLSGGNLRTDDFLNAVFGFSVQEASTTGVSTRGEDAQGTVFANIDSQLTIPRSATGLMTTTLPDGAKTIAAVGGFSTIVEMTVGTGKIIFIGWDYYNSSSDSAIEGGVYDALKAALIANNYDDQVTTDDPAGDDFTDDATTTGLLTIGAAAISGRLQAEGDRDWFKVTTAADTNYRIELKGVDGGNGALGDVFLRVFDAAGNFLRHDDDSGDGRDATLIFNSGAGGDFFLSAAAYRDLTAGDYTIEIRELGDVINARTNIDYTDLASAVAAAVASDTINVAGVLAGSETVSVTANALTINLTGASPQQTFNLDAAVSRFSALGNTQTVINGGDNGIDVDGGSLTDNITGGAGVDTLRGNDGDDVLTGGGGDDVIDGGAGADTLNGGDGADAFTGGDGDDLINGNAGADFILGGDGADTVEGGAGDDYMDGGLGGDILRGGAGNDTILGGSTTQQGNLAFGDGLVAVDPAFDTASFAQPFDLSDDLGFFNDPNVTDSTTAPHVTVFATTGLVRDLYFSIDIPAPGRVTFDIDGGVLSQDGFDAVGNVRTFLELRAPSGQVVANNFGSSNTDRGTVSTIGNVGQDPFLAFDVTAAGTYVIRVGTYFASYDADDTYQLNVTLDLPGVFDGAGFASDGANQLFGEAGDDVLTGNVGNDLLDGGDGNDRLTDSAGTNTFNGGAGLDTIVLSGGTDTVDGGADFDLVIYQSDIGVALDLSTPSNNAFAAAGDAFTNVEAFQLTEQGDVARGGTETVYFLGMGGDDILIGGSASDGFIGGAGADYMDGGSGNELDTVFYSLETQGVRIDLLNPANMGGAAAGDTILNMEGFVLTAFGDSFEGADGVNFVYAGAGNDQMFGSVASNDWFFGEDGDDFLAGGTLDDRLEGGAGNDTFAFIDLATGGNDTITDFDSGNDVIQITGAGFGGLAAGHVFTAGVDFFIGTGAGLAAGGAVPTLLYDFVSGALSFDADGSGAGAAITFATLTNTPGLSVNDISVVAVGAPAATPNTGEHVAQTSKPETETLVDQADLKDGPSILSADFDGDDFSRDTSTTGVATVGGRTTGNLEVNGDRDWFKITLEAGSTYTIDLRGLQSDRGTLRDPYLRLYDADGNFLRLNDDSGAGLESRLTFTATVTGDHFISAGAFSDRGAGTYEIEVIQLADVENVTTGQLFASLGAALNVASAGDALRVNGGSLRSFEAPTIITDNITLDLTGNGIVPSLTLGSGVTTFTLIGSGQGVITGNADANIILSGDADDTLAGLGGNDTLNGGAGQDTVTYTGEAGVTVDLGAGTGLVSDGSLDTLISIENVIGSNINDIIIGDGGSNILNGGAGDDVIRSGGGLDLLFGGIGDDRLEIGQTTILAGATFDGAAGSDTLAIIDVGAAAYDLRGAALSGIETLRVESLAAVTALIQTSANQLLIAGVTALTAGAHAGRALTFDIDVSGLAEVNLSSISDVTGLISGSDIVQFSNVAMNADITGTSFDDRIIGTTGNEVLNGGLGNDTLIGGDGLDILIGGGGADILNGGDGFDLTDYRMETGQGAFIDLATPANNAFAAAGDSFIDIEAFFLTDQNDQFQAGSDTAFIYGFGGDDILIGGSASDVLSGGTGNDYLDGAGGLDSVFFNTATQGIVLDLLNPMRNTGEAAGDTFVNIEGWVLTSFGDSFEGGDGTNFVYAGAGNDQMFGSVASNDWFFGEDGDDFLAGGTLDDRLEGGAGNDTFAFIDLATGGNDTITDFDSGNDVIQITGAGFGGLAAGHVFTAGVDFFIGTGAGLAAGGAVPTLLYDFVSGALSFDADGSGAGAAITFATLTNTPGLSVNDISVVAVGAPAAVPFDEPLQSQAELVFAAQASASNANTFNSLPIVIIPAVPLIQLNQQTPANITGLSFLDADNDALTVTLSIDGTLTLSQLTGLTFTAGDGVNDSLMTFSGSLADVNAAVAAIDFLPSRNNVANVELDIIVSDGSREAPSSIDVGTLNGSNGFQITGTAFTRNVASFLEFVGDINGDGIDDILINDAGTNIRNGEAHFIFGRNAATDGDFASSFDVSSLNGTNGFTVEVTNNASDRLLISNVSSAGDINNDGIADFLVEVTGSSNAFGTKRYAVFGQDTAVAGAFPSRLNLDSLDGTNGFLLDGASGLIGAAGDINGDGIDDILVNSVVAPQFSLTFTESVANVIFGRDVGTEGAFSASLDLSTLDGTNGFSFGDQNTRDRIGRDGDGIGDINGDGIDDFVVNLDPGADSSGLRGPEEVFVVFGRNTAQDGNFPADITPGSLDGTNGFRIVSAFNGFGQTLTGIGDVNGDGIDDMMIGAPSLDFLGAQDAGAVFVIFGRDTSASGNFQAEFDLSTLDGSNGFVMVGSERGEHVGASIAPAGDINGDGIDDMLVTARFDLDDSRTVLTNGPVFVVYGRNASVDGDFDNFIDLQTMLPETGFRIDLPNPTFFNAAGASVSAAGDVNGDGFDDILVGNAGYQQSYVIFGGTQTTQQVVTQSVAVQLLGPTDGPDQVFGTESNDFLLGLFGDDTLFGYGGDDVLDGGFGSDAIDGGDGFDLVLYDSGETGGAFIDLSDTSNNAFAAAGDTYVSVEGFILTDQSDYVIGGTESVFLFGEGGDDILIGGTASDVFIGGAGADYMDGGSGSELDQVFYSQETQAVIINLLDQSQNALAAAGDYMINIEGFVLTAFGDSFQGGDGTNFVYAGGGNDQMFGSVASIDRFYGEDGDDFLAGGTMDDYLEGGAGRDTFAFADLATGGLDTITDFVSGTDTIQLTGDGFGGLAGGFTFTDGTTFITGTGPGLAATQSQATLLYDTATGALLFDADGTGAGAAVQFATLTNLAALSVDDISVVAVGAPAAVPLGETETLSSAPAIFDDLNAPFGLLEADAIHDPSELILETGFATPFCDGFDQYAMFEPDFGDMML